jgi:hypothetical protein
MNKLLKVAGYILLVSSIISFWLTFYLYASKDTEGLFFIPFIYITLFVSGLLTSTAIVAYIGNKAMNL